MWLHSDAVWEHRLLCKQESLGAALRGKMSDRRSPCAWHQKHLCVLAIGVAKAI